MKQEWILEGAVASALLGVLVLVAAVLFVSLQMNQIAAIFVGAFIVGITLQALLPVLGIGVRFDHWSLWHFGGYAVIMLGFYFLFLRWSQLSATDAKHTALQATMWFGFLTELWDRLKPTNPPPDATWFDRNFFYSEGKFDIADLYCDAVGAFAVFFILN